MKSICIFSLAGLCLALSFSSCKKHTTAVPPPQEPPAAAGGLTQFSRILAKAIASDETLRNFLKAEALKQFDRDFDVLYVRSSGARLSDGRTFREALIPFAGNERLLDELTTNHPLLTIYVPSLPEFDAGSWNAAAQIPKIAIDDPAYPHIRLTDHTGVLFDIPASFYPAFPVLVVKNNERVRLKKKDNEIAVSGHQVNGELMFIDEAFDGLHSPTVPQTAVTRNVSETDPVNIEAFHSGNEWQRDFVYYGITPANPTGKFKNNFSEFITSFRFLNGGDVNNFGDLGLIADQTDGAPHRLDPMVPAVRNRTRPVWTEGNFEFRITIVNNSKNGLGSQTTKILSVAPQKLFDVRYKTLIRGVNEEDNPRFWGSEIMVIRSITPLEFNPDIEIGPWDLQNYGTAWKFLVSEFDDAQESATEIEHSTTYATNFSIDGIDIFKIGAKFGGSMTSVEKRGFTIKTTLGSDFLGEAALSFDQPVITAIDGAGNVIKRSITTGGSLRMTVEPKRIM
ncbi:hypothetical protein C7T94_18540 [Pedobacter yulinensis]|uniref:Uncharacterized protein n=1 Tax=Pedobacter yulinensis TaxID=2126353 RepID=A0A2T3HGQ1_9SPHI|nr:hypothetical protein [Pedobacter yulinensis]PST81617.1 hypothetical protein C7T94_18540 [Pedobacter yulinensis]